MDSFFRTPAIAPVRYQFAGFRLEADGTLLCGETPLALPPQELALLRVLLAHAGEIVTPLTLKRAVWGEAHVPEDSLSQCVASLRARLQPGDCIQTVYKRGYRFSAAVETAEVRPAGALPRLVILPFAVGAGVPEYVGPAVAEEAMARLNAAPSMMASIVARDSVFTLARRGLAAREIGKALDAELVLTGLLRARPGHGHGRLHAELIRVEDGAQLWVEDLLVEHGRIAELSSELVNRLAMRLHGGSLSISAAAEPAAEDETSAHRSEAYELYLRAQHEWQTLERHRMQDGMGRLLRAIELDPSLTAARVGLAHLCIAQTLYGFMSPAIAAGMVRHATEGIPDLSGHAEALLPALSWIEFHVDRNLPAALKAFARTAHLPHDPWITRVRVMFALSRHRFDEALGLLRSGVALDPYSPWLQASLAWALHLAEDAAASVAQIRKALTAFPEHDDTHLFGAIILAYNGEAAQAAELARELAGRSPHLDLAPAVHAYALACAGHKDDAHAVLERLQWLDRKRFVLNTFNPAVYAALGEFEAALRELRDAEENRCPWFFQMLADPRLKALRGHAEFAAMQSVLAAMEAEAERGS